MKNIFTSKKMIITTVLLLVISLSFYFIHQNNVNNYESNFKKAKSNLYILAILSEKCTDVYSETWREVIKSGWSNGKKFKDFNEAIYYRINQFEEAGTLNNIDSVNMTTKSIMKKMSNPPSKYKNIHDKLMLLYIDVSEYVALANQPEGSLQSFNQKRNDLSSSISRILKELEILIPFENESTNN